jgi:hypothetical protein
MRRNITKHMVDLFILYEVLKVNLMINASNNKYGAKVGEYLGYPGTILGNLDRTPIFGIFWDINNA